MQMCCAAERQLDEVTGVVVHSELQMWTSISLLQEIPNYSLLMSMIASLGIVFKTSLKRRLSAA
jgi:hypothetical protein